MKIINISRWIAPHLRSRTGKLLGISLSSAILALLPWQPFSSSQIPPSCNYYGCYPAGGGCNAYGCWTTPDGGCNFHGCWSTPVAPRLPKGICPTNYPGSVLVEFVARGDDWANVWMDGREVFQPRTFDRTKTVTLCPGAYKIIITGITRFEVWATGYLDIGRTNIVRVAFSKDGRVEVSGDPNTWLPGDKDDPHIWDR